MTTTTTATTVSAATMTTKMTTTSTTATLTITARIWTGTATTAYKIKVCRHRSPSRNEKKIINVPICRCNTHTHTQNHLVILFVYWIYTIKENRVIQGRIDSNNMIMFCEFVCVICFFLLLLLSCFCFSFFLSLLWLALLLLFFMKLKTRFPKHCHSNHSNLWQIWFDNLCINNFFFALLFHFFRGGHCCCKHLLWKTESKFVIDIILIGQTDCLWFGGARVRVWVCGWSINVYYDNLKCESKTLKTDIYQNVFESIWNVIKIFGVDKMTI